jgi:hypothetical protein
MNAIYQLPTFLPGRLVIRRGTTADYRGLERFHYRRKSPATWAGVWVAAYDEGDASRIVAAAVLSYPTVYSAARDVALGLAHLPPRERLSFVNQNIRAISRVVVHPQFRSLGLAAGLVRRICGESPTRYVEAFAIMGRVHPFFEKGEMNRVATQMDGPVYYWFERATGK